MITPDELSKYLKASPEQADKLSSEINLLAGQYDIDTAKIIQLLKKSPEELMEQKKQLEMERQKLKLDINKLILPQK